MNLDEFQATLESSQPPANLAAPLAALWWDAKGDWQRAHSLVDELETKDGMAVHAYLHRKEGIFPTRTTGTRAPGAISIFHSLKTSGTPWLQRC